MYMPCFISSGNNDIHLHVHFFQEWMCRGNRKMNMKMKEPQRCEFGYTTITYRINSITTKQYFYIWNYRSHITFKNFIVLTHY